jgi:hypothetical protein
MLVRHPLPDAGRLTCTRACVHAHVTCVRGHVRARVRTCGRLGGWVNEQASVARKVLEGAQRWVLVGRFELVVDCFDVCYL